MKLIKPSPNKHQWPRKKVNQIETRKRDLVIRITNWMKDKEEPGYDVECYIGGVYDWNESKAFTIWSKEGPRTEEQVKKMAIEFAKQQIEKLL